MKVRREGSEPPGERALPTSDLEHHVVGSDLGVATIASSRFVSARKFWPEPHHPNTFAAFASTSASSSA